MSCISLPPHISLQKNFPHLFFHRYSVSVLMAVAMRCILYLSYSIISPLSEIWYNELTLVKNHDFQGTISQV